MERKEEKQYTTGEFAKLFNIKKDTLFYYDRIKLFCPAGIKDNGYRYYTSSQIDLFWTLLSLRETGVPIKKLQKYFQTPSAKELVKITMHQLKQTEAEIKKLQKIKEDLTQISCATKEANTACLESLSIEQLPAVNLLYSEQSNDDPETSTKQWATIYDNFVKETGITGISYIGSVISQNDLNNKRFKRVDRLFTITAKETENIREAGTYAVFYHKGDYDSIPAVYPHIFSEIRKLGYKVIGNSYEEYLISEIATKCADEYVTKIVIKVSK